MAGRPVATDPPPSPGAARNREYRQRQREGLVVVQIGPDRYQVTPFGADQLREIAEDMNLGK